MTLPGLWRPAPAPAPAPTPTPLESRDSEASGQPAATEREEKESVAAAAALDAWARSVAAEVCVTFLGGYSGVIRGVCVCV